MMGRKFLGIQTVISGETRFLRTVYGAILGLMWLKRLSVASPEVIANAIAFLAAPTTHFITGQTLFVDFGRSLGGMGI